MDSPLSTDDRLAVLEAGFRALGARVAELERVHLVGDADQPLSLADVAARIGSGKSVATLRGWMKRPALRRKYRLEALLRRDAAGRWYSTPRLIAQWTALMTHLLTVPRRQRFLGRIAPANVVAFKEGGRRWPA